MPLPLSSDELRSWESFLQAHALLVDRVTADFSRARVVPYAWYDVLVSLVLAPGRRLRMSALADEMMLNRANTTRMVDRLCAAGLVRRIPDPADGRGVIAVLTRAGFAAFRRAMPVYMDSIQRHFLRHIAPDELAALRAGMERVIAAAQEGAGYAASRDDGTDTT